MAEARWRVAFAGPYVSFQDSGRPGNLRFGVPASGPMDQVAHASANVSIGNHASATAIEVSRGGVVLDCISGAITFAVTGGSFQIEHAGEFSAGWTVLTIRAGQRLAVRPGPSGSWAYIAVAGEFDVPRWLGHAATHSMSGFGGGALHAGAEISLLDARVEPSREGAIPVPEFARSPSRLRVVMGPQDQHFQDDAITAFCTTPYTLTDASDRMGARLHGTPLPLREGLAIPSEPILRGSVQVTGDGVPTVLLADHQTTGGYPKIATVIAADLDGFAQLRPGDIIQFDSIEPSEAITAGRRRAADIDAYLDRVSQPGRTLTHRLREANLISGPVSAADDEP